VCYSTNSVKICQIIYYQFTCVRFSIRQHSHVRSLQHYFGTDFIISISRLISTSSPTITPPVSRVLFQVKPKSFLLILVVAEAPFLIFPHGSLLSTEGPSTSSTTSLVTPCRDRSPVTFSLSLPALATFFETKVIVGYLATSKKSALRRCSSLFCTLVLMELVSMVTCTVDFVMSLSSISTT